ncbi:hypothetical protein ACPUD5_26470, partial [Escherichia coli]
ADANAMLHVLPVGGSHRQADGQDTHFDQAGSAGGVVMAPEAEPVAESASGLRLLVVEDNIDSQQLVCELLETLG